MLIGSFAFANNNENGNDNLKEEKKKIEIVSSEAKESSSTLVEDVCTVSCSITYNGITVSATAGNWFSSCSGAYDRCLDKLIAALE